VSVLKIVHIVSSLNVGGAERFVLDLSKEQQQNRSYIVKVISLGSKNDQLISEAISNNIKVETVSKANSVVGQIKLFSVLLGADVIHFHSSWALKAARLIVPFLNKRVIYTRHGAAKLDSHDWIKIHNKLKSHINAVTFVSEEAKEVFSDSYQWESTQLPFKVINNGVVIPQIARQLNNKPLKIGSVGRFVKLKNQINLLESAVLLKNLSCNFEIHFFGDGECRSQLITFVNKHLSASEVTFHGMVKDRSQVYKDIDVLVVTSETEGLSLAIMEAMSFGIPVVATNVGGTPQLITNNKQGWLFEYNNKEQLSEILFNLLDNLNSLVDAGKASRKSMRDNYSIKNAAKEYKNLYEY